MNSNDKTTPLSIISTINAVDGFDPAPLAVEYTDMNTGETRKRLPVMAQVAWFRLKYPEGRFMLNVVPGKDCFVATAKVYKDYKDPIECYLSEATASRGYLPDMPTVSPREWAQTAALGIALRNAGFGLQFHAAGESFDEPVVNELGEQPYTPPATAETEPEQPPMPATVPKSTASNSSVKSVTATPSIPAEDPLESAMKLPCPISKYIGKTLGEMVSIEPNAIVWIATKFKGDPELKAAAKLICDSALAATA